MNAEKQLLHMVLGETVSNNVLSERGNLFLCRNNVLSKRENLKDCFQESKKTLYLQYRVS